MPRYYIDFRGHFGTREDPCGTELPDAVAARGEALRIAQELLSSWSGRFPTYYDEITIEVCGEDFLPVVTIPFSEFARHVGLMHVGNELGAFALFLIAVANRAGQAAHPHP